MNLTIKDHMFYTRPKNKMLFSERNGHVKGFLIFNTWFGYRNIKSLNYFLKNQKTYKKINICGFYFG